MAALPFAAWDQVEAEGASCDRTKLQVHAEVSPITIPASGGVVEQRAQLDAAVGDLREPGAAGLLRSRFDAVSSGGKRTSDARKSINVGRGAAPVALAAALRGTGTARVSP